MRVWVAIWTGSTIICSRIGAWIAGGPVARLLGLLLAAGFLKGLPWTTAALWAFTAGWLSTAIVLGLRTPAAKPDPDGQPPLTADVLTAALHKLAAPHVHLSALADHLDTSPERIREGLTAAGVEISRGVRVKGRGVSTGVKAGHFPPLPQSPSPAPEGVLTSNNNSNSALSVEQREGLTIIRDPADRARKHSVTRA